MSTSLISYKQQSFWLHEAVGEIILSFVLRRAKQMTISSTPIEKIKHDIEAALSASWVSGIIESLGEEYFAYKECVDLFLLSIEDIFTFLEKFIFNDVVNVDYYKVDKDLLVQEISALRYILGEHGDFFSSTKIYSLMERKWVLA